MSFKLGDKVTWRSQSGGVETEKTGQIVEVVPRFHKPKVMVGVGSSRMRESYVVRVDFLRADGAVVRMRLYWPRVGALHSRRGEDGLVFA